MSKAKPTPVDPQHSESSLVLALEAGLDRPAKSRHLSKTRIGWADPDPSDRFATGLKGPCVDSEGYHRRYHWFHVWTRAGIRCAFCWKRYHWEPL